MWAAISWGVWLAALLAPTLVLAHSSLDVASSVALLVGMLFIAMASPVLWRLAQLALLPAVLLAPLVTIYVLQVGAMPGEDVLMALRLTEYHEVREVLLDLGGGLVGGGAIALALIVLAMRLRPVLCLDNRLRKRLLLAGLTYLSAGLVHYSFLREFVPVRPWLSQEVVLGTYPFSLLQPLTSVAMAVPSSGEVPSVGVSTTSASDASQLVVLVIGESARADHWHINGYVRQTTPLIEAINEVVSLPNVRSISDCTYTAVPGLLKMLAAREFLASSRGAGVAALPDYFSAAGFFTAYVTMQEPRILEESGVSADYMRAVRSVNPDSVTRDEMLLPELRRLLAMHRKKKFIVLHLFGSHFQYAQRYPPAFAFFDGGDDLNAQRVATYDNSLVYTDWVLAEVIAEMQRQPGEAVLAYVSDHGENLMDDARQLYRHCDQVSHYDTHVAALLWSRGLVRSDAWERVKSNRYAYVGQEMVGTTLLDLAGITVVREGARPGPLPASLAGDVKEPVLRHVLNGNGLVGFIRDGRSE